jgi:hypothetical protein
MTSAGVSGHRQALAALYPREKHSLYPLEIEDVNVTNLARHWTQLLALVNAVMNFQGL